MSKVPSGWTKDEEENAIVDNLKQVPEETLYEVDPAIKQNVDAFRRVVNSQTTHQQRLQREGPKLPPAPPQRRLVDSMDTKAPESVDQFVQVVEQNGWEDFGFVLYRIDHTDNERWQQWVKSFGELLDESIAKSSGGERVTDNCLIPINDDPNITLDSFATVQRFYKEVTKLDGTVTAGLDHGVCLAADIDAVNSLLSPEEGVEPWVWLIDEHYDFSQIDAITDNEYPGHFPIAIASLIPDMFPMVAGPLWSGEELWSCCSFDETHPVWTTAIEID